MPRRSAVPQHKTLGRLRQVCSLESGAFWTDISSEEACSLHDLTQDEYSSWQTAVALHGESVLRATALQR